jgi:hypothetical protein
MRDGERCKLIEARLDVLGRLLAGVVLVLAVSASGAAAQETQETMAIAGAGGDSCEAWTAARRNRQAFSFEQWVLGYAVGIADGYYGASGRKDINPLHGIDVQGVWTWIDNYCHDHPLEKVFDAAYAFVDAHPH